MASFHSSKPLVAIELHIESRIICKKVCDASSYLPCTGYSKSYSQTHIFPLSPMLPIYGHRTLISSCSNASQISSSQAPCKLSSWYPGTDPGSCESLEDWGMKSARCRWKGSPYSSKLVRGSEPKTQVAPNFLWQGENDYLERILI
jgi:hypothetical protein